MRDTPLYNAVVKYNSLNMVSFHTPGHKGTKSILPADLLELDLTELEATDNLMAPTGPILSAERNAARLFGSKVTFFSAGGCTPCVQAMLKLTVPCGGKVIASRVLHCSAINAMAMLDLSPVFVWPKAQKFGSLFPGQVQADDVKKALIAHPDAACVYVTSPNYYGEMADIAQISCVCREHDIPLVVDNAHGAHLGFVGEGLHPLENGADITADSAHKTLPVMTGGAFLHIANEKYIDHARAAMAMFSSTSPSYPVIVSLDACCGYLKQKGHEEFKRAMAAVERIKSIVRDRGMALPEGSCDPMRITIGTAEAGLSGHEAANYLRSAGLEPEFAEEAAVVLIATTMNSHEDFAKLECAVKSMPLSGVKLETPGLSGLCNRGGRLICRIRRAALESEKRCSSVKDAEGEIAAETVSSCPPGIPVVIPGEEITKSIIKILMECGISNIYVLQ